MWTMWTLALILLSACSAAWVCGQGPGSVTGPPAAQPVHRDPQMGSTRATIRAWQERQQFWAASPMTGQEVACSSGRGFANCFELTCVLPGGLVCQSGNFSVPNPRVSGQHRTPPSRPGLSGFAPRWQDLQMNPPRDFLLSMMILRHLTSLP